MKLHEMRAKRAQLVAEARAIVDKAEGENRELTKEERTAYDAKLAEAAQFRSRIETQEQLADLGDPAASDPAQDDPTSDADPADDPKPAARKGKPISTRSEPVPWRNPKHPYSICRAINLVMEGRSLTGAEGESSVELEKRYGKKAQGFFLPMDLAWRTAGNERRAFDTASGTGLISNTLSTDFVELLRAKARLQAAGARILSDMVGNFSLPRQTSGQAAEWIGQGASPSTGNAVTDQVPFKPRTLSCYTDLSRRLVKQSSRDVEAFVKLDLARAMAVGVDQGGVTGAGTDDEPLGLTNDPDVPLVSVGTNGGALTWDHIVECETVVADNNAEEGSLGYLTNAKVRGKLKRTLVDANVLGVFIWGFRGSSGERLTNEVNGYPAFTSNIVPKTLSKGTGTNLSALLYGNWEDLAIALWGPVDVLVDPYTGSKSGTVRIVNLQEADIHPRHPKSFVKILDASTA